MAAYTVRFSGEQVGGVCDQLQLTFRTAGFPRPSPLMQPSLHQWYYRLDFHRICKYLRSYSSVSNGSLYFQYFGNKHSYVTVLLSLPLVYRIAPKIKRQAT